MGQVTSTYDLLARIEQGDEYAFTALFEKYQKRLALLIYYKLSREMRRLADAEDVLQETFLEAFRDIKRFRYEKPGGFLLPPRFHQNPYPYIIAASCALRSTHTPRWPWFSAWD
jgi:hypothetical protein